MHSSTLLLHLTTLILLTLTTASPTHPAALAPASSTISHCHCQGVDAPSPDDGATQKCCRRQISQYGDIANITAKDDECYGPSGHIKLFDPSEFDRCCKKEKVDGSVCTETII